MRIARLFVPDLVHHVIIRFTDRRYVFDIDKARARYLVLLGRALDRCDWRCIAYALMSNHVHLALVAGAQQPERWLKRVHSPFALWVNKQCDGLGPVVADRPKMRIVPDPEVGAVIAYVHNNPVVAGIARVAATSTWTSHRAYLGKSRPPAWLHVELGLALAGHTGNPRTFDAFVGASVGSIDPVLEGERLLAAARESSRRDNTDLATPVIGASAHVPQVRRASFRRPDLDVLIDVVARVLDVDPARVRRRERASHEARRIAMIAGTDSGLRIARLSAEFGISRQMGSRIANSRRSDDDALLRVVERQLRAAVDKVDTVPIQVAGKTAVTARKK